MRIASTVAAAYALSGCLGVINLMRDKDETGEQPWLAALLAGAKIEEGSSTPTPATVAISAEPALNVPAALNFPGDSLQVKKSTMSVPMQVNGSFVAAGYVYNVSAEAPMDDYPHSLRFPNGQIELKYKYDKEELKKAGLTEEFAVFYYDSRFDEWTPVDRVATNTQTKSVSGFTNHLTPFLITAIPASNGNLADPPACISQDYPSGIGGSAGARLTTVDGGFRYLGDRNYHVIQDQNFADLGFSQALAVATCNGDSACGTFNQHKLNEDADYIIFTAHANIDLYLMYDTRGGADLNDTSNDAPWIAAAGFTNTGRFIRTTDAMGRFRVYKKSYAKGQEVRLHGNRRGVTVPGIQTNYWLVIKRQGVDGSEPFGSVCEVNRPQGLLSVANLRAVPGSDQVMLLWQNPDDARFAGTLIRKSTIAPPSLTTDGFAVSGTALSSQGFRDEGLLPNHTYYYTVFAYDHSDNFQTGVSVVVKTGVDTDGDGLADSYETANFYPTTQTSNKDAADTDGDGVSDGAEVAAGTDPTNPDNTKPVVSAFTLTSQSPTYDPVVRYSISGNDNVGVTGWKVTTTAAQPPSYGSGWTAAAPTFTTLYTAGSYSFYVWARDAAGNVSNVFSSVSVNLQGINVPKAAYVANKGAKNLLAYSIDPATGSLSALQNVPFSTDGLYHIALHPSGKYLYLPTFDTFRVRAYSIGAAGALSLIQDLPMPTMGVNAAPSVSPDGKFLIAGSHGGGSLTSFSIASATGLLTPITMFSLSDTQPKLTAFHPSSNYLFLTLGWGNTLQSISVNGSGNMGLIQSSGVAGPGGPFGILVDPTGRFLYVTSGSVNVYSINGGTGGISNIQSVQLAGSPTGDAYGGTMSKDGTRLYLFGWSQTGNCRVFTIAVDANTGLINSTPLQTIAGGDCVGDNTIALDPTGRYLYMTAYNNTVRSFAVNPTDGTLTLAQTLTAAQGISDPKGLAIVDQHDANDPPVANAGMERWHQMGSGTAALQGHGTFDPDSVRCNANTSNYAALWSFVSKPGGSTLTDSSITNRTTLTAASFTPDVAGDYVVRLTFTDDPGSCVGTAKTSSATVKIKAGYHHTQYNVYINNIGGAPFGTARWNQTLTEPMDYGLDFMWSFFKTDYIGDFQVCKFLAGYIRDQCVAASDACLFAYPACVAGCWVGYLYMVKACERTYLNKYYHTLTCISPELSIPDGQAYCNLTPLKYANGWEFTYEYFRAHYFALTRRDWKYTGYWEWWDYN